MKLKTMKDIDVSDGDDCKFIERYELKKEAINWIKELNASNKYLECYKGMTEAIGEDGYYNVKQWIKYFFNISEEELK